MKPEEYDGIYFIPDPDSEENDDLEIQFFRFKDDNQKDAKPIENNSVGYKYHVAFFKRDVNGDAMFDDSFEAIFADPLVYVKNLAGANCYGCILKKTEKSAEWFDDYLKRAMEKLTIKKLISTTRSILEMK